MVHVFVWIRQTEEYLSALNPLSLADKAAPLPGGHMFVCRMPVIMTDGAVKLRPLKIYDGRVLLSGLNRQDILIKE